MLLPRAQSSSEPGGGRCCCLRAGVQLEGQGWESSHEPGSVLPSQEQRLWMAWATSASVRGAVALKTLSLSQSGTFSSSGKVLLLFSSKLTQHWKAEFTDCFLGQLVRDADGCSVTVHDSSSVMRYGWIQSQVLRQWKPIQELYNWRVAKKRIKPEKLRNFLYGTWETETTSANQQDGRLMLCTGVNEVVRALAQTLPHASCTLGRMLKQAPGICIANMFALIRDTSPCFDLLNALD